MSGLTNLNNDWYNGTAYQSYAFEYAPGGDGSVTWFVGQDKTWTLDGRAIGPNGNVGQRTIPMEPLAIVMNLGMAESFAAINESIRSYMPGIMRFDYIRIYQDPNNVSVTCDPPGYETTEYIKQHPEAYNNMNKTRWSDDFYDSTILYTDCLPGRMLATIGPRTPLCMGVDLHCFYCHYQSSSLCIRLTRLSDSILIVISTLWGIWATVSFSVVKLPLAVYMIWKSG